MWDPGACSEKPRRPRWAVKGAAGGPGGGASRLGSSVPLPQHGFPRHRSLLPCWSSAYSQQHEGEGGRERKGVRRSSERVRGQSGPGRGGARRVSARSRARGREFRSRRCGWPRAPQQPRQKGKKLKQSGAGTGDCRGGRCRERPPEVLSPTLTNTVSLPWREPSSERTRQGKGRVSGRAAFTRSFSKL